MSREGVRSRMFSLVKKVRAERLRALKKPVEAGKAEDSGPSAPPAEELAALEAMLGKE